MANVIDLQALGYMVEFERSDELIELTKAMGAYFKTLPISDGEYQALLDIVIDNVLEAERNAFLQGFEAAIDLKPTAPGIGPDVL